MLVSTGARKISALTPAPCTNSTGPFRGLWPWTWTRFKSMPSPALKARMVSFHFFFTDAGKQPSRARGNFPCGSPPLGWKPSLITKSGRNQYFFSGKALKAFGKRSFPVFLHNSRLVSALHGVLGEVAGLGPG